jgi:hypothetical protein
MSAAQLVNLALMVTSITTFSPGASTWGGAVPGSARLCASTL